MSIVPTKSFFNLSNNTKALGPSLQENFEKSICQGNVRLAEKYLSQGCSLEAPLPNGELPLHLAIRKDYPELTKLFIDKGAKLLQKDFQRMRPLDHAFFSNNPLHKAHILSSATGVALEKIQTQMQKKMASEDSQRLKNKVNSYKTAALSIFSPPIGAEVFRGNLENITPENVNDIDSNGLAPIHYAILGNQPQIVYELITKFSANPNIVDSDGDSLLHIASMGNIHPYIIQMLIHYGISPNVKNHQGQTPLHYASLQDDLLSIRVLLDKQAESHVVDAKGIAPFALIGSTASQRDPLKKDISSLLYSLFYVGTMLSPYALVLAVNQKYISEDQAKGALQAIPYIQLAFTIGYPLLQQLVQPQIPKEATGIPVKGSILSLLALPIRLFYFRDPNSAPASLKTGLDLLHAYELTQGALAGYQTCYYNSGYRNPFSIGLSALAHTITISPGILRISQMLAQSYFAPKTIEAKRRDYANLPDQERILHKDLNPKELEEAKIMLLGSSQKNNICKAAHKSFTKLALQFHPDKDKSELAKNLFLRAGTADETIANSCKTGNP